MELINKLDVLCEKEKKNSRLSAANNNFVEDALVELLEDKKNWDVVFDYLFEFRNQTDSYIKYYKKVDTVTREELNTRFVTREEFRKNINNKGANRCIKIIEGLLAEKADPSHIIFLLKQICNTILVNGKKDVTKTNANDFRKALFNKNMDMLSDINLSEYALTEKEYYNIEKVFIDSAFIITSGSIVPKSQYSILKWLSHSGKNTQTTEIQRNLVKEACNKWPEETRQILFNSPDITGYFGIPVSRIPNGDITEENSGIGIPGAVTVKQEEKKQNECDVNDKTDIKPEKPITEEKIWLGIRNGNIEGKIFEICGYIKSLENYKEKKESKHKAEVNTVRANLAGMREENSRLKEIIESIRAENTRLRNEVENLKDRINGLLRENCQLNNRDRENKENIRSLINLNIREENNALEQFREKLASKMRFEYSEFKETQNMDMSIELGENLRVQLGNIFTELRRIGIQL